MNFVCGTVDIKWFCLEQILMTIPTGARIRAGRLADAAIIVEMSGTLAVISI